MKVNDRFASGRTGTPLARTLACVLLIGIIYAITFGAVHSHRNSSSKPAAGKTANNKEQASFSSRVPVHNHSTHKCLICFLHQQLFSSIVHESRFIFKPSAEVEFVSAPVVLYISNPISSDPIARLSGRAPPFDRD